MQKKISIEIICFLFFMYFQLMIIIRLKIPGKQIIATQLSM